MKNKYVYHSRISEKKFREIVKLFSLDLEADQTANITGLSRNTIKNYRATINAILEMALCDELIHKNPLKFVKVPQKQYREVHIFNQAEMKVLIESASGQHMNILLFTLFTGLRGSELIALRWHDIDFNAETITIDTRIREGIEDVTKSKRVRIIDMLPQAKQVLKMQQRLTGLKNNFVFVTHTGAPPVSNQATSVNRSRDCANNATSKRVRFKHCEDRAIPCLSSMVCQMIGSWIS